MGEYASGLTSGQCFAMDKERIKHALRNELICGEDEHGFLYAPCDREEAEAYILSAFDNAVHQCLNAHASGRALDRIIRDHTDMDEKTLTSLYMHQMCIEAQKFDDYEYEDYDV